jgi:hypothetical protein
MATAALGGASVGVGTITYAHGDGSFRYGATDDLQLEATTGVRSCTDCSPLFPERGVVAGAAARLSVLRTNGQQLAVTAGGSAVDWHVSGTKLGFEASLLHDVAFGRFALVTRIATLHGDHPWNLTVALEPQVQLTRRLMLSVSGALTAMDAVGFAAGRNAAPLAIGASAVAYEGREVRYVDVGVAYQRSNALATGAAVDRGSVSGYVRMIL